MSNRKNIRILVIDDEKHICDLISESLASDRYSLQTFCDPAAALEYLNNNYVDIVLTDLMMGKYSGEQVLEAALKRYPDAVVILMTAHPTVQAAISALKKGAFDFLVKPFKLDVMKAVVSRGLNHQKLLRENVRLRAQVEFLAAANACGGESDLDKYLPQVLRSCKTELSASACAIFQIDPKNGAVIRKMQEAENPEDFERVTNDELLEAFIYTKSARPNIQIDPQPDTSNTRYLVQVTKPIFVRRTLNGIITLLIPSHTGQVAAGELDVLSILANSAAAAIANDQLYGDLQSSYLQAIRALANAIEARDDYTAGHTDRVTTLASAMAAKLGWDDERLQCLFIGCTLHDIGKIGVPDAILNKPSAFTDAERIQMMQHPLVGLKIVQGIELLKPAIPYILSHHERYDGTGYPRQLQGEKIPIEGRLLSVADTFDAMVSDRPYRRSASLSKAVSELLEHRGSQFDPYLVDLFLSMLCDGEIDLQGIYGRTFDIGCLSEIVATQKVPV